MRRLDCSCLIESFLALFHSITCFRLLKPLHIEHWKVLEAWWAGGAYLNMACVCVSDGNVQRVNFIEREACCSSGLTNWDSDINAIELLVNF